MAKLWSCSVRNRAYVRNNSDDSPEGLMHFLSFDEAWQITKDRRQWLLDAAEESRLLKLRRRQRPRPPVDDLLRSPGGPPAA
jgi:hypothetical protein